MAAFISSEQRVVAFLATSADPQSTGTIAYEAGVSEGHARQTLLAMCAAGRVTMQPIAPLGRGGGGAKGRPGVLWQLTATHRPPPEVVSLMRVFSRDTVAIAPSGREVRVLGVLMDGRVACEYLDEPVAADARVTLPGTLLRALQPGRARPTPVRV